MEDWPDRLGRKTQAVGRHGPSRELATWACCRIVRSRPPTRLVRSVHKWADSRIRGFQTGRRRGAHYCCSAQRMGSHRTRRTLAWLGPTPHAITVCPWWYALSLSRSPSHAFRPAPASTATGHGAHMRSGPVLLARSVPDLLAQTISVFCAPQFLSLVPRKMSDTGSPSASRQTHGH